MNHLGEIFHWYYSLTKYSIVKTSLNIPCYSLVFSAPPIMQGLLVLFARIGSGDPVGVLCLFHNKYTGYN